MVCTETLPGPVRRQRSGGFALNLAGYAIVLLGEILQFSVEWC